MQPSRVLQETQPRRYTLFHKQICKFAIKMTRCESKFYPSPPTLFTQQCPLLQNKKSYYVFSAVGCRRSTVYTATPVMR